MINPQELVGKSRDELAHILANFGKKAHHKAKPETLIQQILHESMTQSQPQNMQHKAFTPQAPVYHNTEEDIRTAIKDITAKQPALEVIFPGDGTWWFKCNGAEECGNMAIPLRIIKQKAEFISKGRRALLSMGKDNTYQGYADTIIAG